MAKSIGKWGLSDYLVVGGIVLIAGTAIGFTIKQIMANNKVIKDTKAII